MQGHFSMYLHTTGLLMHISLTSCIEDLFKNKLIGTIPGNYNLLPNKLWAIIHHNNHNSIHILISQQTRGERALLNPQRYAE